MENSAEIFAMALGLNKPWSIKKGIFDKKKKQLDIYLEFAKGHKFETEDGNLHTAHDTVTRIWKPPCWRERHARTFFDFDSLQPFGMDNKGVKN